MVVTERKDEWEPTLDPARLSRLTISERRQSAIANPQSGEWLGDRDSNPDKQIQSLLSCRWTIPQRNTKEAERLAWSRQDEGVF